MLLVVESRKAGQAGHRTGINMCCACTFSSTAVTEVIDLGQSLYVEVTQRDGRLLH